MIQVGAKEFPKELVKWFAVSEAFSELAVLDNAITDKMVDAVNQVNNQVNLRFTGEALSLVTPTTVDPDIAIAYLRESLSAALYVLRRWYLSEEVAEIRFAHNEAYLTLTFDKRGLVRNRTNIEKGEDNALLRRALMSVKVPMLRRCFRHIIAGKFEDLDLLEQLLSEIHALVMSCGIIQSMRKI